MLPYSEALVTTKSIPHSPMCCIFFNLQPTHLNRDKPAMQGLKGLDASTGFTVKAQFSGSSSGQ